jgi:dihydropteroate synthase
MRRIGVTPYGIKNMAAKMRFHAVRIEGISSFTANIIKQHMLSCGADAAIAREALVRRIRTSCIIFGTTHQIRRLIARLAIQPFESQEVARKLTSLIEERKRKKAVFKARARRLSLGKVAVCGIINVTPDSFSGDGLLASSPRSSGSLIRQACDKVRDMVKAGAVMVDVGAESSRPYARPVSEKEEIRRLVPVVKALRRRFPRLCISVDTYKYNVAKEALACGADVINDITALRHSPDIASLISRHKAGCILMHMQGTPRTMQKKPVYRDVVEEVMIFLKGRMEHCLKRGIPKERLLVDPGMGFGKTFEHNITILKNLSRFRELGVPVFIGLSRKSFIAAVLKSSTAERLYGTIGATIAAAAGGVDIVRVHDVRQTVQALKVAGSIIDFP